MTTDWTLIAGISIWCGALLGGGMVACMLAYMEQGGRR